MVRHKNKCDLREALWSAAARRSFESDTRKSSIFFFMQLPEIRAQHPGALQTEPRVVEGGPRGK